MKLLIRAVLNRLDIARGPMADNGRRGALHRVWGHVVTSQIKGHYYEFGVYRGASMIESWRQYQGFRRWIDQQLVSAETWRRAAYIDYAKFSPLFVGFDTFSGMPANDEDFRPYAEGTFATDEATVRRDCAAAGLSAPTLRLVSGMFADHRPEDLPGPAAIINIDADLHGSARDALALCRPIMQQGTVVMADEYNSFAARRDAGERRAIAEFSVETGIEFEPWFPYQYEGRAFMVHLPHRL